VLPHPSERKRRQITLASPQSHPFTVAIEAKSRTIVGNRFRKGWVMDFSFAAIIGLVTAIWGGMPADADANPKSLIEAIYSQPATEAEALTADDVYSTRLQGLFAGYFRNQDTTILTASGEAPPINLIPFDPLSLVASSGQVEISEPLMGDRQATITVDIERDSGSSQLSLFLIEQDDGWRIDDIASFDAGGQPWLLSWILRYDPPIGG